jgi:hypothetical protein
MGVSNLLQEYMSVLRLLAARRVQIAENSASPKSGRKFYCQASKHIKHSFNAQDRAYSPNSRILLDLLPVSLCLSLGSQQ